MLPDREASVDFQRPNRFEILNQTTDRPRRVFRKTPPPPRSKERDAHLPNAGGGDRIHPENARKSG